MPDTRDFINQLTEIKDTFYCQRVTSKEGKDGDEALNKFKKMMRIQFLPFLPHQEN